MGSLTGKLRLVIVSAEPFRTSGTARPRVFGASSRRDDSPQDAGTGARFKTRRILARLQSSCACVPETDLYRDLYDRIGFDPESSFSFEDYSRLPVLERDDVRRAGSALISNVIPADQLKRDATGGSTGKPTEIWMGPEENGWSESGGETFFERLVADGTRTGCSGTHSTLYQRPSARSLLCVANNNDVSIVTSFS